MKLNISFSHKHFSDFLKNRSNISFFVSPTDKIEIENVISLQDSNKSVGPNSTYLLHGLTCIVPCVRGLHYTIIRSTLTLGIDCPTPCISIMNQQCIQTFNC